MRSLFFVWNFFFKKEKNIISFSEQQNKFFWKKILSLN